jgi:hypothetical protein
VHGMSYGWWLRIALVLLAVLGEVRFAVAQERHVSVELVVPRDARPDLVCVRAPQGEPEPRASCAFAAKPNAETREIDDSSSDVEKLAEAERERCDTAVKKAQKSHECSVDLPDKKNCADALALTGKSVIHCALNSQNSNLASPRLLLLDIMAGPYGRGVVPTLRGVTVNGNEVVLRITRFGAPGVEAAAHLWVLGGHYQSGNAAVTLRESDRVSFALRPRHVERQLSLPPSVDAGYSQIHWVANGPDIEERGDAPRSGTPRIFLPMAANELGVSAVGFDGMARWTSEDPPNPIVSKLTRVVFSWAPHCLYDRELFASEKQSFGCPTATLPQAGAACVPSWSAETRLCVYSCSVSGGEGFLLPTPVEFSSDRKESPEVHFAWTDQLRLVGETLRGYVAAPNRQLLVDFRSWPPLTENVGERIDYVLLWNHGEQSLRVAPSPGERTLTYIPHLACGDTLAYEPKGDLRYKKKLVRVGSRGEGPNDERHSRPGGVKLSPPAETLDEPITPGLAMGAGAGRPFFAEADARAKWNASLEAIARINLRAKGEYKRQAVSHVPSSVELRFGVIFSHFWTEGLIVAGDQATAVTHNYPYLRFPLTPLVNWTITSRSTLGLGAGLAYQRPLMNADLDVAPAQFAPVLTSVAYTYRVSRAFGFDFRGMTTLEHGIISEIEAYGFRPRLRRDWVVNALFWGGFRFDL